MSMTFDEAASMVKSLRISPTNEELLEIYACFKQATCGDNDTCKPGTFDFRGKAKWQAWNLKKGMTPEEARTVYVQLVEKLVQKYG